MGKISRGICLRGKCPGGNVKIPTSNSTFVIERLQMFAKNFVTNTFINLFFIHWNVYYSYGFCGLEKNTVYFLCILAIFFFFSWLPCDGEQSCIKQRIIFEPVRLSVPPQTPQLRVRSENDELWCTLKTPSGEWGED